MHRPRPGDPKKNDDLTPEALQRLRKENVDLQKKLDALQQEVEATKKRAQADQVKNLADRETLEAKARSVREASGALEARLSEEQKARREEAAATQVVRSALEREKAEVNRLRVEKRAQLTEVDSLKAKLEDGLARLASSEVLDDKLTALITLNRALQEELDDAKVDLATHRRRGDEADVRVTAEVAKVEKRTAAEKTKLETTLAQRSADNASLVKQLQAQGKTPFLSPEQVSGLLDRFYQDVSRKLTGLDVRESEIRLKVGFAGISPEDGGLVVPTTANLAAMKDGLSEVVLKLGRRDPTGR